MEGTQSLQFWSIFGPIYPRETKNIGKSQNFEETTSSGLLDYASLSSQINHIIVIIKKTPSFRPKMYFLRCEIGP